MKWMLVFLVACGSAPPKVDTTGKWPEKCGDYDDVTTAWTRRATLRGQYQEALDLTATFKSPEWRCAHAKRDADFRRLEGDARNQVLAQAKADSEGAYEIELMVTTWERRENDLDHGKKSVWRVVIIDDQGKEIVPTEIVKDRRPPYLIRAEFPMLGDFAIPYIARFAHEAAVLGPNKRAVKLRMSSERGGVEIEWQAP